MNKSNPEHPNQFLENILINKKSIIQGTESPGIYLLINNDEIIYIGKSLTPKQRVGIHQYSNKKFDSYYIISCNEEELRDLEAKYIFKYHPKHNKIMPFSKSLPYIGKTTSAQNNQFLISCVIINNRLYADLSKKRFNLIQKEKNNKENNEN
jgi:excinuclease UvrABC nuclease subunit